MSENQNGTESDLVEDTDMSIGELSLLNLFSTKETFSEGRAVPLWMIIFTDLMALMLTFFVLMYSMRVPEEEKWKDVTSSLTFELKTFKSAPFSSGTQDTISIDKTDFSEALDLDYLKSILVDVIKEDKDLKDVILIPQKDRLIISLPSNLLFESGSADVQAGGKKALFGLGGALSRMRNRIEIMGHADPRPIQAEDREYQSNWELSLARATSVAAVLESVGYQRPIIVRGLSSARYDELPNDLSENEKLDYARRVDVVVLKHGNKERIWAGFGNQKQQNP